VGQFSRHVFVCTHGEYCPFGGSVEVHRLLKDGIKSRGLKTSVRINKSGCFDQCGNGPMVVVYPENVWYGGVTPENAARILEEHLVGGKPVQELQYQAPPGPNKNGRRMAEIDRSRAGPAGSGGGEP
jgi:(2Fe-2S) ferredoxin